jgi:hypothetical protein
MGGGKLNHIGFQRHVTEFATIQGWQFLTIRRSIGRGDQWITSTNITGWPDLLLWHPAHGGCIAAELKIPPDRPTPAQREVLASLNAAHVRAYVWTPADWSVIEAILTEPNRRARLNRPGPWPRCHSCGKPGAGPDIGGIEYEVHLVRLEYTHPDQPDGMSYDDCGECRRSNARRLRGLGFTITKGDPDG